MWLWHCALQKRGLGTVAEVAASIDGADCALRRLRAVVVMVLEDCHRLPPETIAAQNGLRQRVRPRDEIAGNVVYSDKENIWNPEHLFLKELNNS